MRLDCHFSPWVSVFFSLSFWVCDCIFADAKNKQEKHEQCCHKGSQAIPTPILHYPDITPLWSHHPNKQQLLKAKGSYSRATLAFPLFCDIHIKPIDSNALLYSAIHALFAKRTLRCSIQWELLENQIWAQKASKAATTFLLPAKSLSRSLRSPA